LLAYTPLKRISPICTFVGAFPGAMPGVLGWTAARGRLDWGALVLFAILFLWQFPHFFAIAWIYREDYAKGSIRMLPVVEPDGRSTALRMLLYSLALLPISLAPAFLGMTGQIYLGGAVVLGLMFVFFSARMTLSDLPVANSQSRVYARRLFQCSILYLPLLFVLMMSNSLKG
jgi:protoheme IX farnesyltransferase